MDDTVGNAARLAELFRDAGRHIVWSAAEGNWVTAGGDLTPAQIEAHLAGRCVVGAYPAADGVARFGVIDIDLHLDGRAPTAEEVAGRERYAVAKARGLEAVGVPCLLARGHDAGSYPVFFAVSPMRSDRLGRWLRAFVAAGRIHVDTFPSVTGDGNAVRLPGRHHKRPDQWSAAWDGAAWGPWPAPVARLLALPRCPARLFLDPGKSDDSPPRGEPRGDRPGDVFNLLVPVEQVLEAYGWTVEREVGDRIRFTRPGKAGGVSASVRDGTVWVYTSGVEGLPATPAAGKPYAAFGLVAYLEYKGDFKNAARELFKAGFCPDPPAGQSDPPVAGDWPAPVPLSTAPPVPEYPCDVLPQWLREWAAAVAIELQVPVDLPAGLGLGLVAAGVARKVVVRPRKGFDEPVNQFVMAVLAPGERKSQTFRRAIAPVLELQREAREAAAPAIAAAESDRRIAEKRVKHLEEKIAKAPAAEREALAADLVVAREELLAAEVPPVPVLYAEDDTPESLKHELIVQGGRLMVTSTEAKCIENITLYSDRPNFDVFLKGHAGDEINTGRVVRGRESLTDPALSCLLTPQPGVVRGLAENEVLRGRGFLARWFYQLPSSLVGARLVAAPPVPDAVQGRYHKLMRKAWEVTYLGGDADNPTAHALEFDAAAAAVFEAFEAEVEPLLASGRPLSRLAGWGNKLNGACARVAAALHVADQLGAGEPWAVPIGARVIRRAARLCREYYVPHAVAAFDLMGVSAETAGARRVWAWVRKSRLQSFTARDAFVGVRGGSVATMDDLQRAWSCWSVTS